MSRTGLTHGFSIAKKLFKGDFSIKMKIIFWYTSFIVSIIVLFLGSMFYISSAIVRNSAHSRLKKAVENTYDKIEFSNNELLLDDNLESVVDDIFISIYDNNLNFVYGDAYLELEFEGAFSENGNIKTVKQEFSDSKWYIYEIKKNIPDGYLWIRGIAPASAVEKNIEMIIRLFLIFFPFLIIISAFGGYTITKKAFEPIKIITRTAEEINEGNDLSKRINITGNRDEISTLANTFDKMFDRLQEAFDREVQFTSDVSHELRTPISIISSQSEYGLKYLDTDSDTEEILKNILDESKKMSTLVSKLLMLARMDKGHQKLNIENINLSEILQIAIESKKIAAKKKSITIESTIIEDIFIDADENMIMRTFVNLISNAISYGKKNGKIWITLVSSEDKVICKIADDGIGIEKKHIDKIWNRFYQVDPSHSGDNSGLGLSMVKWIIEAHKGKITVESEFGKGSVFILELPLKIF